VTDAVHKLGLALGAGTVDSLPSRLPNSSNVLIIMAYRKYLLIPSPFNLGVHIRQAGTKCLPTMVRLRPSHAGPSLDLVRARHRRSPSSSRVLQRKILDVYCELRLGGLGYT